MISSWQAPVKTLINTTIVTMEEATGVIENGFIIIEGDSIKEIGAGRPERLENPIDLNGKIVIPGLINAHTHLAMTLYRGLADDLPLHDWLHNHIWPAEAKNTTIQNIITGTNLGLCELIRTGTTTFNDMYFFAQTTAECAAKAGVRAVLSEGIVDFPTKSYATVNEALSLTEIFIDKWKHHPVIHPSVVLHSPYACSLNTLLAAKQLAKKHQTIINIHISETKQEVSDSLDKHQKRPVTYLSEAGFFDVPVCAAHMVWPDDSELQVLSDNKVSVAHCVASNLKLGSGVAPVPEMISKGINVALGTDGCASNNNLNLFREMHMAALIHKGITGNPQHIPAQQALAMATINGAKALNLDTITGSLKVGKRADLVVIDTRNTFMTPVYDVYSAIVYALESHCVETVMVNGRTLMIEKELLTIDEPRCLNNMKQFLTNNI